MDPLDEDGGLIFTAILPLPGLGNYTEPEGVVAGPDFACPEHDLKKQIDQADITAAVL